MKHVFARRLGVLALGSTLALGSYVPAAQAATSPSGGSAAGWLLGDLPAQNFYSSTFIDPATGQPYDDIGLTIDTGLAAVATGNSALVDRTRAGVASRSTGYTAFGSSATAKALAFAVRTGANPRAFGGEDLVALTEANVQTDGQLLDGNVIGQAFAAEGLNAVGSTEAPAAVSYLQGLQCATGAFGLELPAPGAPATCTDASANPGADITSLVGTALARRTPTTSVDATIDRAGAFLVATGPDGAFGDAAGPFSVGVNSNSTGLAASLLGASCRVASADQAADRVRALQVPAGASGPLTGQAGAVALNRAAYDSAQAEGITEDTRDQFRRSTSQAATGLVWDASAPATVTVSGPTQRVAKGSAQTLTVTGAARGETVCLTTPTGVQRLVGTGAPLTVPVTAPATGAAGYSVTTGPGAATYALRTGNPRAQLKNKRVTIGGTVTVKIRTLQPGTRVVTKIRGTKVDRTRARANGVATVRFRITGKAARAAQVSSLRRGQVRQVTLRIKPAGTKAVTSTLRITRP